MNKLIVLALVVVSFSSCKPKTNSTTANDSFQLSGKLAGLGNDTILLIHRTDETTITDTAIAKNDSFSFTGKCPEARTYILQWYRKGDRRRKELFIENMPITVSGNADSVEGITVSGSPMQKKYEEFLTQVRSLDEKMDSLSKVANSKAEGALSESDKKLMAAIDTAYDKLDAEKKIIAGKFIALNPASHVSSFLALRSFAIEPVVSRLDSIFKSLDSTVQNGYYGKQLNGLISSLRLTEIGSPAPSFSLPDTSGNPVSLDSYKGKVLLVDFWASWCVPCRHENPNVVKAYQKFHPKGLEILGVSLDEKRDRWIAAIIKDNLSWQHVSDLKGWNNSAAKLYAIRSIPNNYLIGKDGKIIAKGLHGDELTKKLEEVLK
jgi:peroxiredoxin